MKTCDIIVVGAGPAGLGACLKAASLGLKTALIERRTRLSPLTRACSEGLLYEEYYYGDEISVNTEQGTIDFKHNKFSLTYTGRVREVSCFINVSKSGNRMKLVRENNRSIHLVFDKGRFLEENLSRAIAGGVSYFPGQSVTDIQTSPEAAVVHTNRESFKARFLIAADGHNSWCARLAGFDRDRKFYGTLTGACWHVRGFEPGESAHIHLLEGAEDPSVFCACPRAEESEYSVLISGFSRNPDYWNRLKEVKNRSVLSSYFTKNFEIIRQSACVLNLCEPLTNPCRDTVFVIGDGAWFGQTSNTHAALTGVKAVECIFNALQHNLDGDALYEPYRAWWTETFVQYMKVPGGGNIFEELTAAELDELFSFMPDKIVASMEPKKARELLGAFFQKLLPEVQRKNPRLAEKIIAIQKKSTAEAWAEKQEQGYPVEETAQQ